jgi:hypothetical protein
MSSRSCPRMCSARSMSKFLGKVIRLTAGHQAKVEEKPEVRKAGGVRALLDLAARRGCIDSGNAR